MFRTVLYGFDMPSRHGAEDARNQLPALLDAAERGESTIITRRGRPVAVLAPMDDARPVQQSLLTVAGTGRGLWGVDSAATIRKMRDEWGR